jgi:hypothetical protein
VSGVNVGRLTPRPLAGLVQLGQTMNRAIVPLACVGTLLLGLSSATAEEKKEPSAKARETAKLLKDNVAKFSVTISGYFGKHKEFVLVTDKKLIREGTGTNSFVISEDQAKAVVDSLITAGQLDKPTFFPPAGPLSPGWYLYVGLAQTPPRIYQWRLGDDEYDLTADATIAELIKVLEGDSKKALQQLAKDTAKKR